LIWIWRGRGNARGFKQHQQGLVQQGAGIGVGSAVRDDERPNLLLYSDKQRTNEESGDRGERRASRRRQSRGLEGRKVEREEVVWWS